MSMRLDRADVLRRIIENPSVFPMINDIDAVVRKVVVGQLKAAVSVDHVKTICSTLGDDNFRMLTDGMTDAEAKSIVTKIDKENKEVKLADGFAQRILLVELATGKIEPKMKEIKQTAAKKPTTKATSSAGKAMRAASPGAKRKTTPKGV